MRRHLGSMNVVTAVLCLLGMGLGTASAPAQDAASSVARVSFVQGTVQLLAGQGAEFTQAVINMPVLEGSRLQTGEDGQAEVEFGDGSVGRLTPNSSLQFGHLGQDQVQMQQLGGLGYYEFNVGEGHPSFDVQFANVDLAPTGNSILRVGLDAGWEVAVIAGAVHLQGNAMAPVDLAENQSFRAVDEIGAPTIAQGINGDSWDNWNQDRDQAIAQEAAQQTPVRDDSANPQNENWNDLDASGNWYPVEGAGNVWVPAGIGAGWDPYGAGYWAYYPTLGYTWVSSYPWGWLPYHCGNWGYYSFGWGWAPGGCGRVWSPVIVVRNIPPGWRMPDHPLRPGGGIHPVPGRTLIAVDRGAAARGPWALNGSGPRPDHQQALNLEGGRTIVPIGRIDVRSQSFTAAKGTAPGTRAVLSGAPAAVEQRSGFHSTYVGGGNANIGAGNARPPAAYPQGAARPSVGYSAPPPSYNQRSTYVSRPEPSPHYSAPPQPHYSAPPAQSAPHMSSPGPHR